MKETKILQTMKKSNVSIFLYFAASLFLHLALLLIAMLFPIALKMIVMIEKRLRSK